MGNFPVPVATHTVVVALIPVGTVHQLPFEVMKAGNGGPFPFVQCTASGHYDIALVLNNFVVVDVFHLDTKVLESYIWPSVQTMSPSMSTCFAHHPMLPKQLGA